LKDWWMIFVFLVWFLIQRPTRWWFYIGLIATSLVAVYRGMSGHYYIMLVPFVAIAAAISLRTIFERMSAMFPPTLSWRRGITVIVCSLLMIGMYATYLTKSPSQLVRGMYGDNPFLEARIAAEHVVQLTNDTDYVFIAGSEPEILFYAERRSSSRFVIAYPMMIHTPVAHRYQEEAIKELEANPPKVIVYVRVEYSWLRSDKSPTLILDYLDQLIQTRYHFVGSVLRGSDHWQESLTSNEFDKASLIVCLRNENLPNVAQNEVRSEEY
jgi:hypothetical protein